MIPVHHFRETPVKIGIALRKTFAERLPEGGARCVGRAAPQSVPRQRHPQRLQQVPQDPFFARQVVHGLTLDVPSQGPRSTGVEQLPRRPGERMTQAREGARETRQLEQREQLQHGAAEVPAYLDEVHICPYCKKQMSCCEAPPIHIGDGLGWGSEVLFICLNDTCSLFADGWEMIEEKYGHHASYRYMELPGSKESNIMMVASKDAYTGSIIDPQELKMRNERFRKEKQAIKDLESCVEKKNLEPVLFLILDEAANISDRKLAASYLRA